ncbi:MAG: type II 3-dehydroquinate dehydratase [Tissierellia bacterium]|nr:type II 3-dehydroquinate dehydratase [Tissierellia bacterium]
MKILILNGPNINMLGIREPEIYGKETYEDLINYIKDNAGANPELIEFYQSNHEGDLVDKIQQSYGNIDGIVINAGAYTHTSVAILDALKAVNIPAVEVHISNIETREDFRQVSYIGRYCELNIKGRGFQGYVDAVKYLREKYSNSK